MKGFVPTPPEIVDWMFDRLFADGRPTRDDTILDPGCGDGAFIQGLFRWCARQRAERPRVLGVDSDPRHVARARPLTRGCPEVAVELRDFLLNPPSGQYDYIIGNPPYVAITALTEKERATYRGIFKTAHGRLDLYFLFFERAISLLKPGGRLVFITPEKFLYVESATPLRRLLSSIQVEAIDLLDEGLFPGLITYPAVTTLVNSAPSRETRVRLRNAGRMRRVRVPVDGSAWWPAIRSNGDEPANGSGGTLEDVCVRVSCGVATGADAVFVHPPHALPAELQQFAHPTISGRELQPGRPLHPRPSATMLVPYNRDGELLGAEQLGPLWQYLSQPSIKSRLQRRTCAARKPWYAFHETPPLDDLIRPKLLCKDIASRPHFWPDYRGDIVPRHSVYYIVPKNASDLEALGRYLNSTEAQNWLFQHCQQAANGFLRLQSSVLRRMPVPGELLRLDSQIDAREPERSAAEDPPARVPLELRRLHKRAISTLCTLDITQEQAGGRTVPKRERGGS